MGGKVMPSGAVRLMVDGSGKSARAVSRELGKGVDYVNQVATRTNAPRLDTLARIAGACGYRLEVRVGGESATITPND